MRADPFSGAVCVFRAKQADRVKLVFWDGSGVCLFASVTKLATMYREWRPPAPAPW
jgi:transposase